MKVWKRKQNIEEAEKRIKTDAVVALIIIDDACEHDYNKIFTILSNVIDILSHPQNEISSVEQQAKNIELKLSGTEHIKNFLDKFGSLTEFSGGVRQIFDFAVEHLRDVNFVNTLQELKNILPESDFTHTEWENISNMINTISMDSASLNDISNSVAACFYNGFKYDYYENELCIAQLKNELKEITASPAIEQDISAADTLKEIIKEKHLKIDAKDIDVLTPKLQDFLLYLVDAYRVETLDKELHGDTGEHDLHHHQ